MTKAASALLADALRLSESARTELAAESLGQPGRPCRRRCPAGVEAEIGRRIAAIESGGLALESWDDMKQRVAKDVLGR